MPLKPHPTDPDKLVFTAGDYAMPTYFTSEHAMSMTLRDYFAASIMQALITRETKMIPDPLMYAGTAYALAAAMLEARKNEIRNP
jgi:hypothetical protein